MKIYHNLPGLNLVNAINKDINISSRILKNLSSGLRINQAADDAANLSISERMRAQIRGMDQANHNLQDGISLIQTADNALSESQSVILRMRELALQAANDTYTSQDRIVIQKEIDRLKSNLDDIAHNSTFNNKILLDGSSSLGWSSSSDKLRIVIDSTVKGDEDADRVGSYLLDIQTQPGTPQVLGTSALYVRENTIATSINSISETEAFSGLSELKARGLAEGSYRLETRETPFGGLTFLDPNGAETLNAESDLGYSLTATSSPKTVPFGEYDLQTADIVPFMASFSDNETGSDVITGVSPTGRDGVDVKLDIAQVAGPQSSLSEVAWIDIGGEGSGNVCMGTATGGDVAIITDSEYSSNLTTHFQVEEVDSRDLSASDITVTDYYRSSSASSVSMNLTYKTQIGEQLNARTTYLSASGSAMDINLTYKTGIDSRLGVTATYNSQAGETITAHTTYITGSNSQIRLLITDGLGAVVGDTVIDISSQNINETAASLEGVINTLNGEMFKDINFLTKDLNNGRRSVIVQNGSIDYSIAISDVSGSSADELGINHAFAASTVSDGLEQDYYRANTIAAENMDITKVADSINTALASYSINTSVTDNGDGTSFISINNNSSNYQVEFLKDYNANSVESELGLNSASILGPNSSWASSINVFDNYYFSIDTENFTLVDLASAWQNEINNEIRSGAGITGVTVNTSGNGLSLIEIMNNSAYKLAFTDDSGSSLDELALAKDVARGSSIISNKVYHDYDVQNIAVGNRNLSSIVSQLNGALQSVLSGDGVESPAAMPFIDYNNGDGTHAVRINNSMESATLYQIAVSDHTGSTATELGIGLQVINRNEVYSNSTLRDLNKSHTLNLSNMNIVEVASTLNNYFSLQGYNVEFLAAATKNELYRLNIVNHSGGPDHRLEILNQTGASMENELSIGGYTLDPGNSISSNQIYHNHVLTTTVNDRRLDQIASRLNYVLNWDLATDGLTNPAGGIFQLDGIAVGERRIRVNNSGSFNTRYEITLKDIQGTTLADLGLNHTVLRGQLDISGISRDYGKIVGVIASGSSIEKVRNSINNWNLNWLVADWYDSASTPGYDGSHHNGRIIINNNDNSAARREVVFQSSAGTNQLFGVSGTSISIYAGGNNRSSSTWQARDRALVRTQYIGVNANGSPIAGSRSDWWWEGDTGSSNDLVDSATELPFQSIYVPDNQSGVELEMGDSFCINTYAHSEGPHDLLTLDTVDGFTGTVYRPNGLSEGGLSGGSFVFNDGVLDNNSSMLLPQMLRTGMGTYTTINHDFDFGEIHTENNAAVYSERYSAGDFNWYAHAFYGDDATYFFAEGGSPTQYFNNVKVWRQEDDNCSLLFTVTGAGSTPVFQIEGKGYNRDGSVNDFGPITMSISGGPVKIGCIQFDDLQFGQGLSKGDRFVINIAARAGDSYHDNPPSHSDVNIAISGNPWSTGGSSMEYRFREGVENSSALNLLGYFVDPLNGGRDNGVWTGNLVLDTSANGFNNNSRVGSNSRAHLEINYQGLAASEAGAGLTGYYFQNLQPDEGPASFLNRIECNPKENRNASLMFEVIESGEHFVVLRGQAHVYDKEGKYSYFYDDYIRLAECNINTVLFNQPGFEGITFSCLEFSNISRWQKGDRFSVSLTANAEGVNSTADELEIFGTSDRREVYPHGWRFNDGVLDKRLTTLRTYQIDFENGEVHDSEIDVSFGQFHGGSARGIEGSKTIPRRIPNTAVFSSSMETGETNLAHRYSRLQDLSAFYTSEGKFLLDTPRQIKLFSNGKEATIDLYATDEIVTLMDRINDAIHCVLGQESVVAAENRSKYTSFAQPSQNEGLAGSMLIKSALAGNSGEITFTGEEGILRALEVTVLSNSTENQYTITAHKETDLNNQIVVSGTEDIILPIAEGLKIKLSPDTGIMQSIYNETTEKFVLESFNNQIEYICLHDKAPYLQAGSNEGQTIKLGLGDVTPIGLELDSLLVVTREQATRAITRIDKASNKISSMRGSLGALENRLQKSINTLSVNIENLTGSEAQIRDTDMANQMMELIKANLSQQTALALISSTIIEPMMVLRLVI